MFKDQRNHFWGPAHIDAWNTAWMVKTVCLIWELPPCHGAARRGSVCHPRTLCLQEESHGDRRACCFSFASTKQ